MRKPDGPLLSGPLVLDNDRRPRNGRSARVDDTAREPAFIDLGPRRGDVDEQADQGGQEAGSHSLRHEVH